MPSKGPSGNTTTTTINPTQQAQLPFLTQGWNQAKNLYETIGGPRYFPGDTMAPYTAPSNYLNQGYQGLVNTAQANDAGLRPAANSAWYTALTGSGTPVANQQQQYALGQDPDQKALRSQADQAIASGNQYANALSGGNLGLSTLGNVAQGQGAGMEELAKSASGAYLNSNPYLDRMAQAAMDPVTRNYQTSTAPTLASQMSRAGRYGSGAFTGAQGQNEQNLGKTLADMSANLYGTNYSNERARQDAAAQQYAGLQQTAGSNYGNLYNQGQSGAAAASLAGLSAAGQDITRDIAFQQDAQGKVQQGQQFALQQYPNMLNSQYNAANQLIEAGKGFTGIDDTLRQQQQAGINDQMNRYNATQMEPFKDLSMYLQNIGQPTTGSSSTTTPYFQNQFASTLSGLTGLKSLLGGTGGLAGLGGAGSTLSSALAGDAALTAAGVPTLTAGLAGPVIGAEAAAGAGGLGSALAAAPAAWIICTELMRQGKLDRRYWRAGTREFASYPEIGRRGYYVWAIPSVRHLRRKPDSLYSRLLGAVFRWRAEDIAARAGVRGARRLWRGRAVTLAIVLPCLALGALSREQDWQLVYRKHQA